MSRRYDAVVVGGGLAGAAVAYDLADAGRDVVLVERESGPHHKVCGEFLSFEALHYLEGLGVDARALGAVPIDTVGVTGAGPPVDCPLPFPALSLSRHRLDEALLARTREAGATLIRGTSARTLVRTGDIWTTRLSDGQTIEARDAFVATGKHDLKGWKRPPGSQNDLIGFKLHFKPSPGAVKALAGRVELFLFRGGYGGLQPIENGLANLCLLVLKQRFQRSGSKWERLLADIVAECPHLDGRLAGAEPMGNHPLAVTAIPYGFVRQAPSDCWHLGDQAAVIPSFAGEGMSIALHSGRLAAAFYLGGHSASMFQRRLARDVGPQIHRATTVSRLLVKGWAQRAGLEGVRLVPAILGAVARATRIDRSALA